MTQFEYLESIGQINIFDILPSVEISDNTFEIGDTVKIQLIDEETDGISHNYLKYYYPHVIGKVGNIVSIEGSSYQVYVNNTYIWLSAEELAYE